MKQIQVDPEDLICVVLNSNDPGIFIVSMGLQDAYVELELEEAVAYAQQREQYLRV